MRLPYGISHFPTLVEEGYEFIDKTHHLAKLEAFENPFVFYLRPRRFGKSLWISLLEHYYGKQHAGKFEQWFGNYAVGSVPTPKAHQYSVLVFDFSAIPTHPPEQTIQGFTQQVKYGLTDFMDTYGDIDEKRRESILSHSEASVMIGDFFSAYKQHSICLLIDEYDQFANELLAFDFQNFTSFVGRNGFVRKFYERLKITTRQGIVKRMFITGVSPITLDSLTSGFNIASNLSLEPDFIDMMGFCDEEVRGWVHRMDPGRETEDSLMSVLRTWYDGYCFDPELSHRVYNPDMTLYCLRSFNAQKRFPKQMLDTNVASDYGKLRRLFQIQNPTKNYEVLDQLLEQGHVLASLIPQFSFEREFTRDDFVSLLFYAGLLTFDSPNGDQFRIPNYVIKGLYLDFLREVIGTRYQITSLLDTVGKAVLALVHEKSMAPLVAELERTLEQLSNRDFRQFDEKYIKLLLMSFLNHHKGYYLKSEPEVSNRYADLVMIPHSHKGDSATFVFELKYLKKSAANQLATVTEKGKQQLSDYLRSEEIQRLPNPVGWLLVFVGAEASVVMPVKAS